MYDREKLEDLIERARATPGPDPELDTRLWCLVHGYQFLRFSTDDDYAPAYRDVEPGPQYREGCNPKVGAGLLLYYHPTPDRFGLHYQRMMNWTRYTSSVDAVLALIDAVLPGWKASTAGPDPTRAFPLEAKAWAKLEPHLGNEAGRAVGPQDAYAATAPLALIVATLRVLVSFPLHPANAERGAKPEGVREAER